MRQHSLRNINKTLLSISSAIRRDHCFEYLRIVHIQHGGCIMAERMTLEAFFFLEPHHDQAKSAALSPLLANRNQYFHNIAALSAEH
jgi:hypothetical protein